MANHSCHSDVHPKIVSYPRWCCDDPMPCQYIWRSVSVLVCYGIYVYAPSHVTAQTQGHQFISITLLFTNVVSWGSSRWDAVFISQHVAVWFGHVILVNDTSVSSVTLCVQETTRGKSLAYIDLLMLISNNYSVVMSRTGILANILTQLTA